jgi:hypothetical protein
MTGERRTGWEDADRWFSADEPGGGGGAGGGAGGDGEGDAPPPVPRCEVCGSELEHDQTYCLECGSPTPLAPRLSRGGRAALIVAAAMVVLGLGAGALAYAVVSDDDGGGPSTATTAATATFPPVTTPGVPLPPATGPLPPDTSFTTPTAPTAPTSPAPPATGFDTVTGPPATTPPETAPPQTGPVTPPEPEPEPDTGAGDWPPGETAWTAILSSVRSESDARAAKSRVAGSGEPAGVLFSTDFPELREGYWVVFSGTFGAKGEAVAQAGKLRPSWPGAYARRISG